MPANEISTILLSVSHKYSMRYLLYDITNYAWLAK